LPCVLLLLGLPLSPALGLKPSHPLWLPQCSQHCRCRSGLTRTLRGRNRPLTLSMPGERRQQRVLRYALIIIADTHYVLSSCLLISWQQDKRLAEDPEPINANHIIDDMHDSDSNCPCCKKPAGTNVKWLKDDSHKSGWQALLSGDCLGGERTLLLWTLHIAYSLHVCSCRQIVI
jgi:hypothetical protein